MPLVQFETQAGEPLKVGKTTIVPFNKALRLPFGRNGGLIWNRPVAIAVQSPDEDERVIPIIDVTRQAEWTLYGAALLFGVLLVILVGAWRKLRQ